MKALKDFLRCRWPWLADVWGKFRWYTSLAGIRQLATAVQHWGNKVECPLCGWRGSSFYPHPPPNERPNALCPRCGSKERQRALYLYLRGPQGRTLAAHARRILEIGPGPYSDYLFRDAGEATVITLDRESPFAALQADVCSLPFANQSFSLVICYHVLEHVLDDLLAIRELRRVLNSEGLLLVQVPVDGDTTREDPSATGVTERLKLFGQGDHVRSYGRDFASRLWNAGLDVEEIDFAAEFSDHDMRRFGLRYGEPTYVCRRKE